MSDHDFEAFKSAWREVRRLVGEQASEAQLEVAVDRAVRLRTEIRDALTEQHGFWICDQMLFEHEIEVGALARRLDEFSVSWLAGERPAELRAAVARLLVTPGDASSQRSPPLDA